MAIQTPTLTVEQFDKLVTQPDYIERNFEYIGGEMVEVVSNNYASELAFNAGSLIKSHLRQNKIAGRVLGADGGFRIAGERYNPDVAYISKQRQPQPSRDAYNANIPELVIEVISNTNSVKEHETLRVKITNYLSENILVWVINPDAQTVEVHQTGQRVQIYGLQDTLTGGDVLPELRIAVRDIFEDVEAE